MRIVSGGFLRKLEPIFSSVLWPRHGRWRFALFLVSSGSPFGELRGLACADFSEGSDEILC
jgi:hypothetical protein